MKIDPGDRPPRDIYRLMTGLIVPRPIALVSTLSRDGIRNLAPFSFFTAVSANPPTICFSPMVRGRQASQKDTLHNIEATREFVVNVVTGNFAEQMNRTSGDYPPEVDEFVESGLTPLASDLIAPPRVAESPASMECRLHTILTISTEPLGGSLVVGTVVRFHISDELFSGENVDPDRLRAIGRMGTSAYVRTADRFEMPRPGPPTDPRRP
jgi:flavin reductase (DIM6/NTAB) family NADH-FMN oxidoreductase RutF